MKNTAFFLLQHENEAWISSHVLWQWYCHRNLHFSHMLCHCHGCRVDSTENGPRRTTHLHSSNIDHCTHCVHSFLPPFHVQISRIMLFQYMLKGLHKDICVHHRAAGWNPWNWRWSPLYGCQCESEKSSSFWDLCWCFCNHFWHCLHLCSVFIVFLHLQSNTTTLSVLYHSTVHINQRQYFCMYAQVQYCFCMQKFFFVVFFL